MHGDDGQGGVRVRQPGAGRAVPPTASHVRSTMQERPQLRHPQVRAALLQRRILPALRRDLRQEAPVRYGRRRIMSTTSIGRFRYIAWMECPYRVAGKASALPA